MTAPMYDRPTWRWSAWCRRILAATRRPDPMRRHTAAMTALRKATR